MSLVVVLVIAGALVGLAALVGATISGRESATRPGPVDVTDRDSTPPTPGSDTARTVDVPGSQHDRAAKGKP